MKPWYMSECEDVLKQLNTSKNVLDKKQAENRLEQHGENVLLESLKSLLSPSVKTERVTDGTF